MNTREKMAVAMYLRWRGVFSYDRPWESAPQFDLDVFFSLTDAALDAMREPTEDILNARIRDGENGEFWRDMIDAIKAGK